MKLMIVRAYVTLLDANPGLWRRVEMPVDFTLNGLHGVIRTVMGWYEYRRHHFRVGAVTYGKPSLDDPYRLNEEKRKLGLLAREGERAFEYFYDDGAQWHCAIVLEALTPATPGVTYPRLIDGAGRHPRADAQDPSSDAEFIEADAEPGANPLDVDEINRTLARFLGRRRTRPK